MFKIDIHTHIIPNNLNEIISTFNDKRFLSIKFVDDYNAVLIKDDQDFRKISCNCWHPQKRISEFSNTGVEYHADSSNTYANTTITIDASLQSLESALKL